MLNYVNQVPLDYKTIIFGYDNDDMSSKLDIMNIQQLYMIL